MFTKRFNNWRCKTFVKHLQIIKTVFCRKSFSSVFKIFNIVTMPYNSKRIGVAEADLYFGTGN